MRVMRIAIVTPSVSRRGGTEKCLSWLIEDLSRVCEVTVFTGEVADVDVSRARVHLLPVMRHPRLLGYLTFLLSNTVALALHRALRRPAFDAVLATAGDCLFTNVVYAHFCCAAWSAMLRTGQVGLPATSLRRRLRNLHYRLFLWVASRVERAIYRLPRVTAVVAVSNGTKSELVRYYGVAPARITVIPNAVDERVRASPTERLRFRRDVRAQHALREDATVLLFVAAGDWKRKGLLLVLEALALLRDRAVFLLVLGREDLPFYEAAARRLGIAEQVRFCGFTSEIARYYAAADLFVYPSRYEACSLVSLEAAGAGLPLLVTRINGTEELVRDGENGFFVEPDPEDIAAKVRILLDDRALRQRMSAAAISRTYSRTVVAERTLSVCSSRLSATPNAPPVREPER